MMPGGDDQRRLREGQQSAAKYYRIKQLLAILAALLMAAISLSMFAAQTFGTKIPAFLLLFIPPLGVAAAAAPLIAMVGVMMTGITIYAIYNGRKTKNISIWKTTKNNVAIIYTFALVNAIIFGGLSIAAAYGATFPLSIPAFWGAVAIKLMLNSILGLGPTATLFASAIGSRPIALFIAIIIIACSAGLLSHLAYEKIKQFKEGRNKDANNNKSDASAPVTGEDQGAEHAPRGKHVGGAYPHVRGGGADEARAEARAEAGAGAGMRPGGGRP